MLLEVPHERVTIMEELGRGAFGRVYKSVMRGYLKRIHSPNQRITVLIRMRDVLLLQKFHLVGEFRIWQKDNLLFQQTLFTGVILINNKQERLSCNRFELFNPIDGKHHIVENSI